MTLVELVVVVAIFAVVSSIVIFNYGSFKSSVSLQNLSEDIALSVRRAQAYAIGVQGSQVGGGTQFPGYGIHFDKTNSPKAFVLFADISGNKKYNNSSGCGISNLSATNECMEIVYIKSTDSITDICGDSTCGKKSGDIMFLRPNPDAFFSVCPTSGACGSSYSSTKVEITSQDGIKKIITVWNTGQISIK